MIIYKIHCKQALRTSRNLCYPESLETMIVPLDLALRSDFVESGLCSVKEGILGFLTLTPETSLRVVDVVVENSNLGDKASFPAAILLTVRNTLSSL